MKIFKTLLVALFILLLPIRSYALESTPDEEDKPIIYGMEATVKTDNLNLRSGPDTSYSVITTLHRGDTLTILEEYGKWFEVDYNGTHGYVSWEYISFVEEEITADSNLIGNSIIHYTSSSNRDTNISIACQTINGIVLKPGDTFRWSEIIGQTTTEKGYMSATVIVNRRPVPGLGGGVCQVSTTIYNALLDTEIVPDEVHRHSIGSAYAAMDATVAYGYKDFVFTNSYDFAIQIETYSYKSVIVVNIYKVDVDEQ